MALLFVWNVSVTAHVETRLNKFQDKSVEMTLIILARFLTPLTILKLFKVLSL